MTGELSIHTPLKDDDLERLEAGLKVLITGRIYTARDAAHKRLVQTIMSRGELPFNLRGQVIYYTGPTLERPGAVIGSAGPTTSSRMDPYTPQLLEMGVKGTIGKGPRGREVIEAMVRFRAVYFAATGGVGVLLAKSIKESKVIAYPELGPEAVRELYVVDFPCIVAVDIHGTNIYELGVEDYKIKD
ncbi:MAG: Fe-S-containing hydro-lyase [Candidatus Bathyarchaeia archaeon]